MSRLDDAAARFVAALDSVESAVASKSLANPRAEREAAKNAALVAELSAERDRLLARIAELEDEARALSGLTEEVEGRLDGAIAEIRAALSR